MNFSRVNRWVTSLKTPLPERRIKRVRRPNASGAEGKKTGLPINRWLALVFEWNEFRSLQYSLDKTIQPLTDDEILYNLKQEFGSNRKKKKDAPANSILSGKHTVNFHRTRFNKGILFKGQPKNILVSWCYHTSGKITKGGRQKYKFPTFQECQQNCIEFQIADPRFFTPEDMEKIHQFALSKGLMDSWSIPYLEELDEITKYVPITLYRSVMTYDIWKEHKHGNQKPKRETINTINQEIEKEEKLQLQELENQRKETLLLLQSFDELEEEERLRQADPFDEDHGYGGIRSSEKYESL